MTAELSRYAIDLGIEEVTALAGVGRMEVNANALTSLAQGYALRALGLTQESEIPVLPDELVMQVREGLLRQAPLDLINREEQSM